MASRVIRLAFSFAALASLVVLPGRPAAAQGRLKAQIVTERGCGANAVYMVGEVLAVTYRIDGASQVQATIDGVFPDGRSVQLYQAVVPGNTTLTQPIAVIGGTLGMRTVRLIASAAGGELTASADCTFTVASAPITAQIATDRGCLEKGANPVYMAGDAMQILFRIDGAAQAQAVIVEVTSDGQSQVIFRQVVPGGQTLAFARQADGAPGRTAVRLTATPVSGGASVQAACGFTVAAAPLHIQRLLAVGDPVAATGRLGMFDTDPLNPDHNISAIRLAADDGSLFVADYAGSAFHVLSAGGSQVAGAPRHVASPPLRLLQAGSSQILLDTTSRDPVDGAGLARLLRVETGHDGTSAILALRADNNRGIYRLSGGVLTRLALLPGPTGPAELAIGDAGQIAYVAPSPAGVAALFQVITPPAVTQPRAIELLSQGQGVLNGAAIAGFSNLTSNGAGDLVVRLLLRQPNGGAGEAVVRKTNAGLTLVAATGQQVLRDRQGGNPGLLLETRLPRIGANGIVVFLGAGDGFANFYVQGPNRLLQPLLDGSNWNPADDTFDYTIAADGAVALRAASGASTASALFVALPSGGVVPIVGAGGRVQPIGQPVFGPDGTESLLFFLGRETDRPLDRNGRIPVALSRSRLANGLVVVDSVAAPGQPVPGKLGAQILTVTQQPVVSKNAVTFGALFGGTENFPVPSGGLFRVPLGGTLVNATLVAAEGADLPGANRVAILRSLAYTTDGTLLFNSLLPGAGSLVGLVTPPRSPGVAARAKTAAAARIQAGPPGVMPLLAIGQPLDRPDRILLAVLGRFIALGTNRQLLVARFSQTGASIGEGLFTLAENGQVQALAVSGDPAPAPAGARFAGFGDTSAYTLSPPAVSADGSVVFKAKLDQSGTPTFGVFQWNGTTIIAVGLANPNPDNLALTPDDSPPYNLSRWSAGPAGSAYIMEQHQTRSSVSVTRLFEHLPVGLAPLVIPGLTPVTGGSALPLTSLLDYVLDSAGNVFVQGAAGGASSVLAVRPAGLAPVVTQGQAIPAPLDGTPAGGLVFGGSFALMPDSGQGVLFFRAGVTRQGTPESGQQGLFRLGPQGVQTLMVESLAVGGSRDLTYGTLATSPDRQTVNGISAFATFGSGRWTIFRWQAGKTTVVAQEGGALPGGGKIVSLDPGAVLDLPPGAGPVFTLNNAGAVAFLATDGTRWGIYLFSDAGP